MHLRKNKKREHQHTPSRHRNLFARFWDFLIHPKKVYYTPDKTGVCRICNASIKVPHAYYHWANIPLYFIVGGISVWLPVLSFHILLLHWSQVMLGLLLLFFFHRIVDAATLAFFTWEECDTEKYDIDLQCQKNSRDFKIKISAGMLGWAANFVIICCFFEVRIV